MSNRKLLQEAIADAKELKNVAIANAKATLEETFTPHLMSMFEKRLAEIEGEDHIEEEKSHEETTLENENDEELNLEALLKELEDEENNETSEEVEDIEIEDEEASEEDAEEELNFDEMEENPEQFTEMIEKIVDEVIDEMIANGELESGNSETENELEDIETTEMDTENTEEVEESHNNTAYEEDMNNMREELASVKKQLQEAITTLKAVKTNLSETNLLNAKLLYINKIFKAKNLTENQKAHVLAVFEKAETVKETKLVYETIKENLAKPETSNKKKHFIQEARSFASKTIETSKRTPVIEVDAVYERMQKLAGIKK